MNEEGSGKRGKSGSRDSRGNRKLYPTTRSIDRTISHHVSHITHHTPHSLENGIAMAGWVELLVHMCVWIWRWR